MNQTIITRICRIQDTLPVVKKIWNEKYQLTPTNSDKISDKTLKPYFEKLRDDLYAIVEYPYVDKMYRDTYYNYYSSKLERYHRDTIRISFFDKEISDADFRNTETKNDISINSNYLGFITLRPTFPKIIGRSALSPKAKKENNILCCLAKINSTVNYVKFKVCCFPHSSQDAQTITCAETTIWSLLEYFGNKYPEYKPVLPSSIHKILYRFSYKRLMPSEGLTAEQVTYAVREMGFGAMIYSNNKYPDTFEQIISTYIESGIPVVAVLTNNEIGHAVNIIGREIESADKVMDAQLTSFDVNNGENAINIIEFSKVERKYVFIDDNHPPYQLANLNDPCRQYYDDVKWHDCKITNIIVPLYPKIYLEANRARFNFLQYLRNPKIGIQDGEPRIVKIFLASSRSYKEYIALNKNLETSLKELFLGIAMSKFIWIAEISKKNTFKKGKCDGIILQDATEPIKHTDDSMLGNLPLIASYLDNAFVTHHLGRFIKVNTFAAQFDAYNYNLR